MRHPIAVPLLAVFPLLPGFAPSPEGEWHNYGNDAGGQRFSPLKQVNRSNVAQLKIAWTYRTGDAYTPPRGRPTAFEATPLYVDGSLYLATPLGRILALDPSTGRLKWAYDAKVQKDAGFGDFASRGVSLWTSRSGERRIFFATVDGRLIAVEARTGQPVKSFGRNGFVDLRNGLRIPPREFSSYEQTSPPVVARNTVIVGSAVADNGSTEMPSGEVRGFDAVTGKLKWTWDPMARSPRTGGANAWSVMAVDPVRNLVFIPTGAPSPDYYGGERPGDNRFANSIVALRADSGKLVWHFQTVHHDLWDYDVAFPPILFHVRRNGRDIAAVGSGPKSGSFFILERETGKPVFGVEERPVPQSDVAGEAAYPTQPFAVAPPPLAAQSITAADAWGPDDTSRRWCRDVMSKLRSDGVFTPPSVNGSLLLPGNVGGLAWGGAAFDPDQHLLFIPTNNLAAEVHLIPRAQFDGESRADRNLEGGWEFAEQRGTPYGMKRRLLRSPSGFPCTPPPWGSLHAIAADSGAVKWSVPTGQFGPVPGSISLGGPIATAGGLVFMAGTLDPKIRAYDSSTGKELWRGNLPTSARATPMTYLGRDRKQYVVIAAGGHGIPGMAPPGDYVVAFTLP